MSDAPSPRPPMTFEYQADLLEYFYERFRPDEDGRFHITIYASDAYQVEDLKLTAQRLRRMVPHEDAIRRLVTGK